MPNSGSQQWVAILIAVSAAVQAATAIIIVRLTWRLVRATDAYAQLTKTAVDLNLKQYDRDETPMWHLDLTAQGPESNDRVNLSVSNLSKNPAIVTHLLIQVESEEEGEPHKFTFNVGMPGPGRDERDVHTLVLRSVESYCVIGKWAGTLTIAIVYTRRNPEIPIRCPWFRFKVTVEQNRVVDVQARLPAFSIQEEAGNQDE